MTYPVYQPQPSAPPPEDLGISAAPATPPPAYGSWATRQRTQEVAQNHFQTTYRYGCHEPPCRSHYDLVHPALCCNIL